MNEEKFLQDNADYLDINEIEDILLDQLEDNFSDLELLESEREQIANPDALGESIKNVIWEQVMTQIGVTAGEDFIKDNNGLNLDLRNEAHIQTTENFADGKIATHNTKINYQERYDEWQSKFEKDENGNIKTHTNRTGKNVATVTKEARKPFDENRPKGSAEKKTDMDHTVPAAEIIRDPAANAHMTEAEQIAFANSNANLNEIDSSLNKSKSDLPMEEWLDTPNANGQKPNEIFDISDEDDKALRQKDKEAREEYENQKKKGEEESVKAGKQSQKEEAFRIGKSALKAVALQLLAEFLREIISKFVLWIKDKHRSLDSLIESFKSAINSFVNNLKTHLIHAGDTLATTIATAIIGPIVGLIKKVWILFKQGWKSLKSAITFLKDPKNKNLPTSIKVLEVGKIITAGASVAGSIILGEVLEKALLAIPTVGQTVFAFQIPLLGSLANIIGIFLGAIISGIIGAIAIHIIDKALENKRKALNTAAQIDKKNEILSLQSQLLDVSVEKSRQTKLSVQKNIIERHKIASEIMANETYDIFEHEQTDNSLDFDWLDAKLDELLND